jgi:ring-1,2-phenylacetyl-CoA epoxidase subunit PaaB
MTDIQWPRFMVFEQEKEGAPWRHNGTVHAPDAEMALLNARDVFSRRPEQAAMFVVPAEAIITKTREELADPDWAAAAGAGEPQTFLVFAKLFEQGACEHIAEVTAASTESALAAAIEAHKGDPPLWWWAFPQSAIHISDASEAASMFGPAREKSFKSSNEYPVVTMMRQLRGKIKREE